VVGPSDPAYAVGTYGVDPVSRTAWAELDHEGEFMVARGIEPVPGHR
jgi:hypothetical protein